MFKHFNTLNPMLTASVETHSPTFQVLIRSPHHAVPQSSPNPNDAVTSRPVPARGVQGAVLARFDKGLALRQPTTDPGYQGLALREKERMEAGGKEATAHRAEGVGSRWMRAPQTRNQLKKHLDHLLFFCCSVHRFCSHHLFGIAFGSIQGFEAQLPLIFFMWSLIF